MQKEYGKIEYSFSPMKFSSAAEHYCNKTPHATAGFKREEMWRKGSRNFQFHFDWPLYTNFQNYFVDVTEDKYDKEAKNAIAFHLFNKLSSLNNLSVHSRSLYVRAARDFCPISLASGNGTF